MPLQKYESIKTALTTSVLQTHSRAGIVSAVRKTGYSGEQANTLAARVQVLGAEGEIPCRPGVSRPCHIVFGDCVLCGEVRGAGGVSSTRLVLGKLLARINWEVHGRSALILVRLIQVQYRISCRNKFARSK
jgi:hypothetical protein